MTGFELKIIGLIVAAFIIGVVIGYLLRTRVFPSSHANAGGGVTLESRQSRQANTLLRGGRAAKPGAAKPSGSASGKSAAKPASKSKEKAAPAASKPANAGPDNLQEIKGIGAVLEKKLNALGIERFAQIAEWTEDDIAQIDEQLNFRGRIQRERWVEQARDLSRSQDS
jgi:predicted flap endonuclease-1-like 5' DNA nuclease